MKKIVISFIFLMCFGMANAYVVNEVPDEFYVNQHWVSYTTSYDVETKTQKLGTLYRRLLSMTVAYDFYDPFNTLLATARSRFFSIGAYFDVMDRDGALLGTVEEKIFTFFPSFTIYGDGINKLAHATMNFWGTKFTITDAVTGREMALMTRSYFRIKNNWTVSITDKALFRDRNIDPKLFMTVAAFQADSEYWRDHQDDNNVKKAFRAAPKNAQEDTDAVKPFAIKAAKEQINALTSGDEVKSANAVEAKYIDSVANQLDAEFKQTLGQQSANDALATRDSTESFEAFVHFCLDKVNAKGTSDAERKAILFLLKHRMAAA